MGHGCFCICCKRGIDTIKRAAKKADMITVADRGEPVSEMEPLLVGETSRHRAKLTDMAVELAQKAAGFRRSLPESLLASLANLVRAMNCYYSHLIEGHCTHPSTSSAP
jgi:hypothetical protein